ncbi:MAG: cytochrome bc complex cytochrome b subunit [Armatimonadota bacterium]
MTQQRHPRRRLRERIREWVESRPELERFFRMFTGAFLYSALDERLSFRDALEKALRKPVPPHGFKVTWCLGGTAALLFLNQVVTGILLTLYYKPSPDAAYESVQWISTDLAWGWLVRQLHAWGAHLMIIFVILHMLRVFLNKAYRPPRELTWVAGAFLLLITLAFAFTGYLLPWDQLSYWATQVGTDMPEDLPLIGSTIVSVLRGGDHITGITLSRFFSVHCIILPLLIGPFLLLHFAIIRRLGISDPY